MVVAQKQPTKSNECYKYNPPIVCFAPPFSFEFWYRSCHFFSSEIYFHCSSRFFSFICNVQSCAQKTMIIYARSSLSSLRLDKRQYFFYSAGVSHTLYNKSIIRHILNEINVRMNEKKIYCKHTHTITNASEVYLF